MDRKTRLLKGALEGLVAGLAASWVMNLFQREVSKMVGAEQRSHGAQSQQTGAPDHGAGAYLQRKGADDPSDNAAERTANLVSVSVADQPLSNKEKDLGGTIFHYAFGATSGAIYGAAAQVFPPVRIGAGLPYGAAIWLIADETVVPFLGLSKHALQYSPATHAYALAAHLVYGLTTDAVLRGLHYRDGR